jgi:putative ABC transport system permease protein
VALAVLAMTVGIVRAQAARDTRALVATGAAGGVRRALTASTAGGLGGLGALLGTAGAYLALAAGFVGDRSTLVAVPVAQLAVIVLGAPAVAALGGWALAGRPPPSLARQPLE